ncbi:hypothetical protein KR059_001745 [Drosophila kikkawai]|nr:hypothetical protein KR059_001745 [Drosophila kikkawai]
MNINYSTRLHTMSIINSEDTNTLVEWNLSDNVTSTPQDSDNLPSDCSSQQRSHLEYVLLDYKQFLAARIIQSNVRGWLCRLDLRKRNLAATTISRWWRGFWVRNVKFTVIEAELQERIMEYFDDMAIKIQSIFRGWHARMNYQDFQGMQSLRMQYAEEMLSELATSLHKMRKDRLLPGIYCLRGSDFLKKIEGLSLTFGYRFHNGRMRAAIAQRRAMVARQRHDFQKSMFFTPAPFPAPASQLAHQPDFCAYKRIGTQQQRLFLLYDKCNRDSHVKKIHLNLSARKCSVHCFQQIPANTNYLQVSDRTWRRIAKSLGAVSVRSS